MENVLVSILCIALILFAAMTVAQSSLWSHDNIATAWKEMENTSSEISRTSISSLGAATTSGGTISMTVQNAGETKLEDFDKWDVILQYYDTSDNYLLKRLGYNSGTPNNDEWTVKGIYLNAGSSTAEVFDPGIFNPDEEMVLLLKVSPVVGTPNANMVTVATYNGISATAIFNRN